MAPARNLHPRPRKRDRTGADLLKHLLEPPNLQRERSFEQLQIFYLRPAQRPAAPLIKAGRPFVANGTGEPGTGIAIATDAFFGLGNKNLRHAGAPCMARNIELKQFVAPDHAQTADAPAAHRQSRPFDVPRTSFDKAGMGSETNQLGRYDGGMGVMPACVPKVSDVVSITPVRIAYLEGHEEALHRRKAKRNGRATTGIRRLAFSGGVTAHLPPARRR